MNGDKLIANNDKQAISGYKEIDNNEKHLQNGNKKNRDLIMRSLFLPVELQRFELWSKQEKPKFSTRLFYCLIVGKRQ